MKKTRKEEVKGITLVSLVITVIIMIILAGIAISAISMNGIPFGKIIGTREKYNEEANNEAEQLKDLLNMAEGNLVFDEKVEEVTDDTPGSLSGSGTKEDPYKIASIEDLVAFSNAVNGIGTEGNRIVTDRTSVNSNVNKYQEKYVELTCTLDFNSKLSYVDSTRTDFGDINGDGTVDELIIELTKKEANGFLPVGFQTTKFSSADKAFQGIFNGNDKMIKNVYVNQPASNKSTVYYVAGGIFGYINNATVTNLAVNGEVIIESVENYSYKYNDVIGCGGVVGLAESSTLKNIQNEVKLKQNADSIYGLKCGGVIGILANSTISSSINNASSEAENYGGVVGGTKKSYMTDVVESSTSIVNCYNKANLSYNSAFGGIVYSADYATVDSCKNHGALTGMSIGGIAHNTSNSNIKNCINYADITTTDTTRAGGISASATSSEIQYCENSGKIENKINVGTSNALVGGIIGNASAGSIIDNCKNNSPISSESNSAELRRHNRNG